MDPKVRAIVREMKRNLAETRRRGHLRRELARLRLTTVELMMIRKGRRA
jgi:hypothetical protein